MMVLLPALCVFAQDGNVTGKVTGQSGESTTWRKRGFKGYYCRIYHRC